MIIVYSEVKFSRNVFQLSLKESRKENQNREKFFKKEGKNNI